MTDLEQVTSALWGSVFSSVKWENHGIYHTGGSVNTSHVSVHLVFMVTVMAPISQVSTLRFGKKKKKNLNCLSVFTQLVSGRTRT